MADNQDANFGKKKKKTKQTLSLHEFIGGNNGGTTSSWADEADVPDNSYGGSAPADDFGRGGGRGGDVQLPTGPRATRGPQLPSRPPWTAFLGNLPYEANDDMIRDFFEGCRVANVRLLRDRETQRLKGFGYVEFETVDDLERALEFNERDCNGRALRVDVAEGRDGPEGGRGGFSRADDSAGWRRGGDGGGGGFGGSGGGFGDRDRGYGDRDRGYGDRDRGYGGGRDSRGFGSGFRDRGYGDRDRGYGDRDRGYGDRDRGYGDRDRGYGDRDRGYGDRDRGYGGRGGYGDRDRGFGGGRGGFGDRDRGFGGRDDGGFRRRDSRDKMQGEGGEDRRDDRPPAGERPRLQLKPRSVDAPVGSVDASAAKKDIFGGAKPNDVLAAEKKLEEERKRRKSSDVEEVTGKVDALKA